MNFPTLLSSGVVTFGVPSAFMLTELKQYLRQFTFLGPKDVADIISISKVVRYKKGDTIVSAGQTCYNMYVVLKGYVRMYVVREDGEERTVYLISRGMGFGSSKTLYAHRPGNETATALENCVVLEVDFEVFRQRAEKNPALYKLYAQALERALLEAVERIEYHSVLNPDQRYEYLQKHRPEILERVPLKYIASYIGITPVSLSRLRARLVGK